MFGWIASWAGRSECPCRVVLSSHPRSKCRVGGVTSWLGPGSVVLVAQLVSWRSWRRWQTAGGSIPRWSASKSQDPDKKNLDWVRIAAEFDRCAYDTGLKADRHMWVHIFWHSIWHIFWPYLANLLAFYLAYLVAFYLTFFPAYLISSSTSSILSGISSGILWHIS